MQATAHQDRISERNPVAELWSSLRSSKSRFHSQNFASDSGCIVPKNHTALQSVKRHRWEGIWGQGVSKFTDITVFQRHHERSSDLPFSSVFYISDRAAYPFQRSEVACEDAQSSSPNLRETRYLELWGKHEMHRQHQRIEIFDSMKTQDPFPHG